eukprot:979244-Karenia_brevis.AAC.1
MPPPHQTQRLTDNTNASLKDSVARSSDETEPDEHHAGAYSEEEHLHERSSGDSYVFEDHFADYIDIDSLPDHDVRS